ncbi:gfo/Idh/MocA family oxidoreductase, partial [Clavibacter phaseoli]
MTDVRENPASPSGADDARLPVVVVGAGAMGGAWIRMLADSPHAAPVGVVDLDVPLAESAVRDAGLDGVAVGASVAEV